jgi:hypothetical protein
VKGVSFLCSAWGGTIFESNLAIHVSNLGDILAAMKTVYANVDVDGVSATMLQTYGTRLSEDVLDQNWSMELIPGEESVGRPPFDSNWIFWNDRWPGEPVPQAAMVREPWQYGGAISVRVDNDDTEAHYEGQWYDLHHSAEYLHPIEIGRPSATATEPDVYKAFVASLPATS